MFELDFDENGMELWEERTPLGGLEKDTMAHSRFYEFDELTAYIVTNSSTDETFRTGDIIWLSPNGDMNNATAGGFLSRYEWDTIGTNDFTFEPCPNYEIVVVNKTESIHKKQR